MKTIKQLLRQPLKTLSGILAVAMAVSVLCICASQAIIAGRTVEALDNSFSTLALQTLSYQVEEKTLILEDGRDLSYWNFLNVPTQEITDFIADIVASHPELVKTVSNPGLASVYIPELTPDNESQHPYPRIPGMAVEDTYARELKTVATYACGIFEIILTEIGEIYPNDGYGVLAGDEVQTEVAYRVTVSGTIENVLSLADGYDDPTGRTARITLNTADMESLDALALEVGGRYLVYTSDYQDGEWMLKGAILFELQRYWKREGKPLEDIDWQRLDTDNLEYLTPQQQVNNSENRPAVAVHRSNYGIVYLTQEQVLWKDAAVMTVRDLSYETDVSWGQFSAGEYTAADYYRYITDENGERVRISEEEWRAHYAVPTMARLDGTAEEFLSSEEGAIWQQYLTYSEINQHAFPVIGIESLNYIADFARDNARIVEGRDFTAEEMASGAKVCILSEALAAANGLSVGDTITPQFYNYDSSDPNQEYLAEGKGVVEPQAYKFTANTQWAGEAEEYTIIGLYRQNNSWSDVAENIYSFTPNTIFVPHSAVSSDMDYSNQAFFQSVVLRNGKVPEFRALIDQAGYEGLFIYHDQGYNLIADSVTVYQSIAAQALKVGLVVYGVILLLFLLLFPCTQGKVLATMTALGAKRGQKFGQTLLSCAGILLPGSLLGLAAGFLLWDWVVVWLAEKAAFAITLEPDPLSLICISLGQLVFALLLTALLAFPLSRNKGISRRM